MKKVLLQKDIDCAVIEEANIIVLALNLAKMVDPLDTSVSNRGERI